MTAEIVSVGTELLLGQIVDTHAATMGALLAECGITCRRRVTVGDNFDRIVEALSEALARADVVATIGGLGPTADDLTRNAIAQALGDRLLRDPVMEGRLRDWFAARHYPWIESMARQADRPESAQFVDNPHGTAPGLICEKNGRIVVALPGPKGEFQPMARGPIREYFEGLSSGQVIHSRVLRICGMGESQVESLLRELMESENPTVAPYAHPSDVTLRLTARAQTRIEADALIEPTYRQIKAILGDAIYGTDDATLEQAVIDLLRERRATLAVAESMTGGGLGERLTSVPGASEVFLGGAITYSGDAKSRLAAVDPKTLRRFGPVSAEVARAMAEGIRMSLGATYGASITGNAGPTSDTGGKPVGTTFIAIAQGSGTETFENAFRGTREDIRRRASQTALLQLRRALLAR